jgi:signal transduction histidine kinase
VDRLRLLDLAVAFGLFGIGLAEVLGAPIADDVVEGPTALNVAAVALTTLPLAVRRRAPFAVAVAVFAVIAVRALADAPLELYPPMVAALVALYSVAAYAPLRDALLAAGLLALALAIAAERGSGGDAAPELVPAYILAAGVLAVGRIAQVRHARALAVERSAEERAAVAVAEERTRLARELHDAVSHSLASIVMQAGGAQDVLQDDPDRAARSLAAIERAAREGIGEMRRLLGLIGDARRRATRSRRSRASTSSLRARARPGSTCARISRDRRARFRRRSTSPRTASSRRR